MKNICKNSICPNLIAIVGIGVLWNVFTNLNLSDSLYHFTENYVSTNIEELFIAIYVVTTIYAIFLFCKCRKKVDNIMLDYSFVEPIGKVQHLTNTLDNKDIIKLYDMHVLSRKEIKKLIQCYINNKEEQEISYKDQELLLNWANDVRFYNYILDMILKGEMHIDVENKKIKIMYRT